MKNELLKSSVQRGLLTATPQLGLVYLELLIKQLQSSPQLSVLISQIKILLHKVPCGSTYVVGHFMNVIKLLFFGVVRTGCISVAVSYTHLTLPTKA